MPQASFSGAYADAPAMRYLVQVLLVNKERRCTSLGAPRDARRDVLEQRLPGDKCCLKREFEWFGEFEAWLEGQCTPDSCGTARLATGLRQVINPSKSGVTSTPSFPASRPHS